MNSIHLAAFMIRKFADTASSDTLLTLVTVRVCPRAMFEFDQLKKALYAT